MLLWEDYLQKAYMAKGQRVCFAIRSFHIILDCMTIATLKIH